MLDPSSFQKLLMKTGLILIVIGHLDFIAGALVNGTVLRHIANPQDTISLQYAVSNIISAISAILTISCGIAAIVLSRYLSQRPLAWAVFSLSIGSTLLSLFCLVGLAVAIGLTFANKGQALLSLCTFADTEVIQIAQECPFDPTRIYSSALVLWGLSFLLDSVEIVFSVRCFLLTLTVLNLKLCLRGKRRKKLPGVHAEGARLPIRCCLKSWKPRFKAAPPSLLPDGSSGLWSWAPCHSPPPQVQGLKGEGRAGGLSCP